MEELVLNNPINAQEANDEKFFITANTISCTVEEIKNSHIIPVYTKDNEALISQYDFIESMTNITAQIFDGEAILKPVVRVSHPVKGRTPGARNKPADRLSEDEKTLYYERMAFVIELPGISSQIDGNRLSLSIGGVKAYNLDNLNSRKGSDEHFKVFVGFQNKVCTNLCVWSDGFTEDLKVTSIGQLKASIRTLLENYNQSFHLSSMERLQNYSLTEKQFAQLIGRCRMYQHLSQKAKIETTQLLLNDTQLNSVTRDYYKDNSFCRNEDGNISLWKLYNLFTGANKASYIDQFLERSVNAFRMVEELRFHLDKKSKSWFLS